MTRTELTQRYQESAVSMGRFMREAGEHIAANEELDLSPDALIEEINSIQAMLSEAKYYATRMQVYANLMKPAVCLSRNPVCYEKAMPGSVYCRAHTMSNGG